MRMISFSNRVDLRDLLQWNEDLWSSTDQDAICFDFSNVSFMTPAAMLFVAHQIRHFSTKCKNIRLQITHYKHLTYPGHMGFFSCFGASFGKAVGEAQGDWNYLPVTSIALRDFIASNGIANLNVSIDLEAARLAKVLTRLGSGYTYDVVQYSIREIMRNTFEHSASKVILYCAQFWPTRSRVEIAIADEGMGIAESLRV